MTPFKQLTTEKQLIYITVVVYIITQLWKLLCVLFFWNGGSWEHLLSLPANLSDLALRPWSLITYMFCHADLSKDPFHIIFNMLWLWCFGQMFLRTHTSRQLVSFYLCSGLFSGLFFILCYNVFPYYQYDRYYAYLVGASGCIFGLIVAVAMTQGEEVIGVNLFVKVIWAKVKWVCVAVLLLNLLSFRGDNTGGVVCHVGGALFGLIYGLMQRRRIDICAWPLSLYDSLCKWFRQLRQPRMKATPGGRRDPIGADKRRDMDYNASQRSHEAQIDAILEKISKHGYDGLTAEEKQMLFDASKRKR